jgi:hypothetical protein
MKNDTVTYKGEKYKIMHDYHNGYVEIKKIQNHIRIDQIKLVHLKELLITT